MIVYSQATFSALAIECSNGKEYQECGSICPKTCKKSVYDCEDDMCIDGCHCPTGTVLDNGRCIAQSQCPCTTRGREFKSGRTIKEGCNKWLIKNSINIKS